MRTACGTARGVPNGWVCIFPSSKTLLLITWLIDVDLGRNVRALCAGTAPVGREAGDLLEPARERFGCSGSTEGDEDRVVAADGSECALDRGGVDRAGDRLRGRCRGLDDH